MVCGGVLIASSIDVVVDDAVDEAAPLEQVVQRPVAGDVVVREVDQRDPRVREREVVAVAECLDEVVLDHPVDLGLELQRIVLEVGHHVLPHVEGLLLERGEPALLRELQRALEVLGLDLDRGELAPVGQAHPAPTRHVVADLTDRPDRVLEA